MSANHNTEIQARANHLNAQRSTGPRTPEGKAISSGNARKLGLFSSRQNVRPDESPDWEALRDAFLEELRPEGILEETFALDIVNAHWRLRRCTAAERELPVLQNEPIPGDEPTPAYDFAAKTEAAISRARVAAENTVRRALRDLTALQAERWRRAILLSHGPIDPAELGVAPLKVAISPCPDKDERYLLALRRDCIATHRRDTLQNEAIPNPGPVPQTPTAGTPGNLPNLPAAKRTQTDPSDGHETTPELPQRPALRPTHESPKQSELPQGWSPQ